MTRQDKLLQGIDVKGGMGLEIGPLTRPLLTRAQARVHYVDHLDTEGLKAKYAGDPNVDPTQLCPVDYVWNDRASLTEVVGETRFDYCVASHVIEHAPDVLGWLRQLGEVLKDGGALSLVIPDKRYTFDCRRLPSRPEEVLDAHLRGLRSPSPTHVLGQSLHYSETTHAEAWRGDYHDRPALSPERARGAWALARQVHDSGEYRDVHCWVFTPLSFLDLVAVCQKVGLLPFEIAAFHETAPNEIDFFATLRKTADPERALRVTEALATACRERELSASGPGIHTQANLAHDVAASRQWAASRAELETRLRAAEAELAIMRASRSWRITAPLRAAMTAVRGALKRQEG